jgi:hypothetical protein
VGGQAADITAPASLAQQRQRGLRAMEGAVDADRCASRQSA